VQGRAQARHEAAPAEPVTLRQQDRHQVWYLANNVGLIPDAAKARRADSARHEGWKDAIDTRKQAVLVLPSCKARPTTSDPGRLSQVSV